ncbi:MAG TPA: hypothetical protein VF796_25920, partial [Humisphaera sp.]
RLAVTAAGAVCGLAVAVVGAAAGAGVWMLPQYPVAAAAVADARRAVAPSGDLGLLVVAPASAADPNEATGVVTVYRLGSADPVVSMAADPAGSPRTPVLVRTSADGTRLAIVRDTDVTLLDRDGKQLGRSTFEKPFSGWVPVRAVVDGEELLIRGDGEAVLIVDLRTAAVRREDGKPETAGRLLVGTRVLPAAGETDEPVGPRAATLTRSRDGRVTAAAVADEVGPSVITVTDTTTGLVLSTIRSRGVAGLALSRDGAVLATSHVDGGVILWDARTGKGIKEFPRLKPGARFFLSDDGTRLLALRDGRGLTYRLN